MERKLLLTAEIILDALKRCSYDAFWVVDSEGYSVIRSDSYSQITGIDTSQLNGVHYTQFKKQGLLTNMVVEKAFKTLQPTTMMLNYPNSDKKALLATCTPVFDENNRLICLVGNVRDMTDLNILKTKLAHMQLTTHQLHFELDELHRKYSASKEYVFESKEMRALVLTASRLSKVDSTVLITGESGVGKGIYAKLIHDGSKGDEPRPFVKISCGAIPESLLESELFGYKPGAFTGADKNGKPGIFEFAQNGTVFLDEVGELPLSLQVKLLNVLQDREFYRLGGTKPIQMNARVIAATNRNLEVEVEQGRFREDLFYRLNVINVEIPPLRDRKDDIVPMAITFLNNLKKKYNREASFSQQVLDVMEEYDWPGNVRQLANAVERMLILTPDDLITVDMLPEKLRRPTAETAVLKSPLPLGEYLKRAEQQCIVDALFRNKTLGDAAKELEIDYSTLTRKVKKFNIPHRNQLSYVHKEQNDASQHH